MINSTLSISNSLHTRLQFTMKVGINNRICFLDITIIIDNQRIIFDTYHKATFSDRFLNFYSNHPLRHKRGTLISLLEIINKIFYISQPRFQQKNLIKFDRCNSHFS